MVPSVKIDVSFRKLGKKILNVKILIKNIPLASPVENHAMLRELLIRALMRNCAF